MVWGGGQDIMKLAATSAVSRMPCVWAKLRVSLRTESNPPTN